MRNRPNPPRRPRSSLRRDPAVAVRDRLQKWYRDLRGDPYSSVFGYGRHRIGEFLEERLPPGDGRRALDAGCGSGYWLDWLAERGWTAHGVDSSSVMVGQARRVPGARVGLADVRHLPYADETFDLVLSIEVIRYLPDTHRVLRELHRVLKPGGVAVVTGSPRFALHGYAALNRIIAKLKPKRFIPLRQYFTTYGELGRSLRRTGFRRVEVVARFLGPFPWLYRLSPRLCRRALVWWAPIDERIAGRPGTRNLCNHLIAVARR